jgi:hypothetical protein
MDSCTAHPSKLPCLRSFAHSLDAKISAACPSTCTTQRLESLVESLCIVKRVKEAVDALSARVGAETRAIIDMSISDVLSRYQEKRTTPSSLTSASSPHTLNHRTRPPHLLIVCL